MSYRDLVAWQKAMALVRDTYRAVKKFPASEQYVLSEQMRKAAISIPSNIAEGQGRWTLPDYRKFLREARGSTLELQTQILIAKDQDYLTHDEADTLIARSDEVGRLINGLLRSLAQHPTKTQDQRPKT
jgi:four helix bundle protein